MLLPWSFLNVTDTFRTTTFSLLEFSIQMGQLIGPIIGSALLLLGLYQPFYFVFPMAMLSVPLALLLPPRSRPSSYRKRKLSDNGTSGTQVDETEGLLNRYAETNGPADRESERLPGISDGKTSLKDALARALLEAKKSWRLVLDYRVIQYGYAASLIITLGKQSLHILLQYVSKRFGVTIAEVRTAKLPSVHN
jgi:MFS family permease